MLRIRSKESDTLYAFDEKGDKRESTIKTASRCRGRGSMKKEQAIEKLQKLTGMSETDAEGTIKFFMAEKAERKKQRKIREILEQVEEEETE